MPWCHFYAKFDYRIARRAVTSVPAGGPFFVKQEIAESAVALGVAKIVDRPDGLPPFKPTVRKGRGRKTAVR